VMHKDIITYSEIGVESTGLNGSLLKPGKSKLRRYTRTLNLTLTIVLYLTLILNPIPKPKHRSLFPCFVVPGFDGIQS